MATKRRTDHDSPRQPREPKAPAVEAGPADPPASGGTGNERKGDERKAEEQKPKPEASPKAVEPEPPAAAETDGRVEELASQLEEANSRHLRLAADFENYKKRVRQEQLDTTKYAAATVAERLLPVVDDADRALSHAPEGIEES